MMTTELERAQASLLKQRMKVAEIKRKSARAERRTRDTALYTVGGCFAALLEDPKTSNVARQIWDRYLASSAPTLLNDRRRDALSSVLGLDLPSATR